MNTIDFFQGLSNAIKRHSTQQDLGDGVYCYEMQNESKPVRLDKEFKKRATSRREIDGINWWILNDTRGSMLLYGHKNGIYGIKLFERQA